MNDPLQTPLRSPASPRLMRGLTCGSVPGTGHGVEPRHCGDHGGRIPRRSASGGFILIAVLWILLALATLATIFSVYLANTAVSLSLSDNDIQTEAAVYAGLELTAYQVSKPQRGRSTPGSPASGAAQLGASPAAPPGGSNTGKSPPPPARGDFSFRLGHASVAVSFIPESSRIDVNAASPQLLTNFFMALGVPQRLAQQYVQRITGWITTPKATQAVLSSNNTEDALYRAAGRPYGPRGAPFAHIDELYLVLDIPPAIIDRAKPFLTVYTGKSQIDVLDAAPEVVAAIPGITPDLLQSMAEERQSGPDSQAGQTARRLLGALPMRGVATIDAGDTYRVQVRVRYDNGRRAAAEVVIRTGLTDKPYGVLWWRNGFDALSNMGPQPGLLPR